MNAIIIALSMTDARRVGIVTLLVLLGGALVLTALPRDWAALRLAGVGVLWWYAVVAAPLAGAAVTAAILVKRG